MRTPLLLPFFIAAFIGSTSSACLWINGTTLDGQWSKHNGTATLNAQHFQQSIAQRPEQHPSQTPPPGYQPPDDVNRANDEAVRVLMNGDPSRAVAMLKEIESRRPGTYFTAANLGTALELAGQDQEALKWILEGIRRNPESHMRTEWLHARILETKIQLSTKPDWLKDHTISGIHLNQLSDRQYTIQTPQGKLGLSDIRESLAQQLFARTVFVKPKDPIVAQMFVELAHVESHFGILEQATSFLDLASLYGAPADVTEGLRQSWQKKIDAVRPWFDWEPLFTFSPLILLAALVFIRVRRRRARIHAQ